MEEWQRPLFLLFADWSAEGILPVRWQTTSQEVPLQQRVPSQDAEGWAEGKWFPCLARRRWPRQSWTATARRCEIQKPRRVISLRLSSAPGALSPLSASSILIFRQRQIRWWWSWRCISMSPVVTSSISPNIYSFISRIKMINFWEAACPVFSEMLELSDLVIWFGCFFFFNLFISISTTFFKFSLKKKRIDFFIYNWNSLANIFEDIMI